MTFQDKQVQQCYDRNLARGNDDDAELGEVHALIATYDYFVMLEGPRSARVHETIDCLLLTRIRPALRSWYHRPGANMDSAAIKFRDQLNHLTGDFLEK